VEQEYVVEYEAPNGGRQTIYRSYRSEVPLQVGQLLETGDRWRGEPVIVRSILREPAPGNPGKVQAEVRVRPPEIRRDR
jgi:hypothetical protein